MRSTEKDVLGPSAIRRIGSVRSLLDELEKQESDLEHVYFYRGHDKSSYKLEPSIYREKGWIENEDILFKELILRCPDEFNGKESTFQTLVKMQHYSLPTRLLDITTNPLIALYFAFPRELKIKKDGKEEEKEDGEVLIFRVPKRELKYFDSDTVSVISNISRRPGTFKLASMDSLSGHEKFNSEEEIKLLLHDIKGEKPYFEPKIVREHLESVICVKSKLDNARIIRQDGAFFLFGINSNKLSPATIPQKYLVSQTRIFVMYEERKKIKDQLELLGISAGTIFPEIDNVAQYIKNLYLAPIAIK